MTARPVDRADPHDLQRFVDAQEPLYDQVVSELTAGRKRSHWMWFVFPQIAGLGHSAMARRYAIASLGEAAAYLDHPVLGARLVECTGLVVARQDRSLRDILGVPDDAKFRSSMTLFAKAAPDRRIFSTALDRHCGGEPDPLSIALLDG